MAVSKRTTFFAALGVVAALSVGGAVVAVKAGKSSGDASARSAVATLPATIEDVSAPTEPLSNPRSGPATTASAALTDGAVTSVLSGPIRLPVPDNLPPDAYAETPERSIGSIVIPRLGVDETLHVGMTLTALNRGPSQWPGTALPGQIGNVVVGGHRTTYGRPFRNLDQLVAGDLVLYRTPAGEFSYAVRNIEVVSPDQLTIADQTASFTSTLFACHPPGSAEFRIVAHLEMLGPDGLPVRVGPLEVVNRDETTRFRTT